MNTNQDQSKNVEHYQEQYEMQESSARIRKANLELLQQKQDEVKVHPDY